MKSALAVWLQRAPKKPTPAATPSAPCLRDCVAPWRTAMLSAKARRKKASGTIEGDALQASERSWRRNIIMLATFKPFQTQRSFLATWHWSARCFRRVLFGEER